MAVRVVLFAIPKNNAIHCATTYNQYLFGIVEATTTSIKPFSEVRTT
jgi:hypothetical protein